MTPDLDPLMLELFQAEMDTHLPVLSHGLLAMEKGEVTASEIEAMMRAAHSIKGAARIVGIEPAVRVSHVMEDFFTVAKEKRIAITSVAVDVLLEGVDALGRICSQESDGLSEADLAALLAKLAAVREGAAPVAASVPLPSPAGVLSEMLVAGKASRCELNIALPAGWDDAGATALRREMLDALSLGPTRITLDFAQVQRLPALAMAMLASLAHAAGRCSPAPALLASGASKSVQAVLRVSGLGGAIGLTPAVP